MWVLIDRRAREMTEKFFLNHKFLIEGAQTAPLMPGLMHMEAAGVPLPSPLRRVVRPPQHASHGQALRLSQAKKARTCITPPMLAVLQRQRHA